MGWKPKEKQLSPEEAVEQARRELAPYWYGGEALLAGVRGPNGLATVHPLDRSIDRSPWLLIFADMTTYEGEAVLLYLREWQHRYSVFELNLLLIVRKSYSFLTHAKSIQTFLKKTHESFPRVLDHDGLLMEAFGGAKMALPAIKLLSKSKVVFEKSGDQWNIGAEEELQKFFRLKDPGLPLSPPFFPVGGVVQGFDRAEFGTRARSRILQITGNVKEDPERILVQDPSATIRFTSPCSRVSIVAHSASSERESTARMKVELNGEPVFDAVVAPDLSSSDDGGFEVKLTDARLYHLLQSLPASARDVSFFVS